MRNRGGARPTADELYGHIVSRRGRTEFLAFRPYVRSLSPPTVRIAVVLDNCSPHLTTKSDSSGIHPPSVVVQRLGGPLASRRRPESRPRDDQKITGLAAGISAADGRRLRLSLRFPTPRSRSLGSGVSNGSEQTRS